MGLINWMRTHPTLSKVISGTIVGTGLFLGGYGVGGGCSGSKTPAPKQENLGAPFQCVTRTVSFDGKTSRRPYIKVTRSNGRDEYFIPKENQYGGVDFPKWKGNVIDQNGERAVIEDSAIGLQRCRSIRVK